MSKVDHKVLFVCLGNICRSPMAEAVFKYEVKQLGLEDKFFIDSAGTCDIHVGESPDSRSVQTCKEAGIPVNHTGQQVKESDFHNFDYILCMDNENLRNLKASQPKVSKAKVELFGNYDPNGQLLIKDPYYGGQSGFQTNLEQVKRASKGLLTKLGYIQ